MTLTERDLEFEGLKVHCWEGGAGFPVLLLHGTGPGTSTIGNFGRILASLTARYRILATDLIGFGLSGRKANTPFFDVELWFRQARFLIDRLASEAIGIIGHSLSGALALRLAAADKRVTKVLTTGAIGTRFTVNKDLTRTWTFPETRDDLRRAIECLVHDRSVITESFLDNRMGILHGDPSYAAYFRSMFGGGKQALVDAAAISDADLQRIRADVIMMHGRDDMPVPAVETTMVMSRSIANCDAMLVGRCGHSPALEHPEKVLHMARLAFG